MDNDTLERRPMTPEERRGWGCRLRTAQAAALGPCTKCGGPATIRIGDVLTGDPYCQPHAADRQVDAQIEEQRRRRATRRR